MSSSDLDGIAFDRVTMERVRKGMEHANPDVRIDIHSSNSGGCHTGGWGSPALQYMQHFPWVDSTWFGEGFVSAATNCGLHCSAVPAWSLRTGLLGCADHSSLQRLCSLGLACFGREILRHL